MSFRALFPSLLLIVAIAAAAPAEKVWREKPASAWSEEETVGVLSKSPWAVPVEILQQSGRQLALFANGTRAVYRTSPDNPPRVFNQEPVTIEPELLRAVYGVRWSSAEAVQQGLKRLEELSPVIKETMAAAPEVPAGSYVLTVRVVTPPEETVGREFERKSTRIDDEMGRPVYDEAPRVVDLFFGLKEEELKERATLVTSSKLRLKPEQAVRHGLGVSEGVTFFFPRTAEGRATLPAGTAWAEFLFEGRKGDKVKAKFNLREMVYRGKADY